MISLGEVRCYVVDDRGEISFVNTSNASPNNEIGAADPVDSKEESQETPKVRVFKTKRNSNVKTVSIDMNKSGEEFPPVISGRR